MEIEGYLTWCKFQSKFILFASPPKLFQPLIKITHILDIEFISWHIWKYLNLTRTTEYLWVFISHIVHFLRFAVNSSKMEIVYFQGWVNFFRQIKVSLLFIVCFISESSVYKIKWFRKCTLLSVWSNRTEVSLPAIPKWVVTQTPFSRGTGQVVGALPLLSDFILQTLVTKKMILPAVVLSPGHGVATESILRWKKRWQSRRYPLLYSDPQRTRCQTGRQGVWNSPEEPDPLAQKRLREKVRWWQAHWSPNGTHSLLKDKESLNLRIKRNPSCCHFGQQIKSFQGFEGLVFQIL